MAKEEELVDLAKDGIKAAAEALRASTMHLMVVNCVSTSLVTSLMGEVIPHEMDIVQISMVSVFAHVFSEDPDRVLEELNERIAQETPLQV
jgi:hypothetical protein